MKEQKKKQLIIGLLFISCVISGVILFSTSNESVSSLTSTSQVDSLIHEQFARFNIREEQISVAKTRIDSNFYRKTFYVGVPYKFSKTQFHARLNNILHPYSVNTPAKVVFPQQDINIHLSFRGTVMRTISLQTDPELSVEENDIIVAVVFDRIPDDDILRQLRSLAEPIPVVIKVKQPMEVQELKEEFNDRYTPLLFWFQNQNGVDLVQANPDVAKEKLKRLEQVSPSTKLLIRTTDGKKLPNMDSFSKLNFVTFTENFLLNEQMGKSTFIEKLNQLSSEPELNTVLISGSAYTVGWLKEKLPEIKTSGINIIPPLSL